MTNAIKKARLLWHCRRGMLELDLILRRFLEQCLDSLTPTQVDAFEQLLNCTDPELYRWLMGYDRPIDKELVGIVEYIRFQDKPH